MLAVKYRDYFDQLRGRSEPEETESVWLQLSFQNPLLYLIYLPAFFGFLTLWVGRYILSGVLYPY